MRRVPEWEASVALQYPLITWNCAVKEFIPNAPAGAQTNLLFIQ